LLPRSCRVVYLCFPLEGSRDKCFRWSGSPCSRKYVLIMSLTFICSVTYPYSSNWVRVVLITSARLQPTGPQNAIIISSLRRPSIRSLMLRVVVVVEWLWDGALSLDAGADIFRALEARAKALPFVTSLLFALVPEYYLWLFCIHFRLFFL
jgi:hypothetical protein